MTRAKSSKRGQGRPAEKADNAVGRDAVLAAARQLVKEHPPARVTIALIAREAGVDPALVRYYFGDRGNLLLAVADSMLQDTPRPMSGDVEPVALIENSIRQTAKFTSSTKHIHRLMVDELADSRSSEIAGRLGEMNRSAVDAFAGLLAKDNGATLRTIDPMFFHVALLGLFDFFTSAEPVIRHMVPEGTDMTDLARAYEDFVADLVLNGIRRR
jgi:TetR/AcrR family transcriptional regulator